MKVVVIGCTHAGTAAVKTVFSNHPNSEVVIYERNDNISFLSCGIALYVEGLVKDVKGLFYSSPEELASLGAKTCMKHDVTAVDLKNKKITVKNLQTDETFEDSYDKLIITSGSWPIDPKIEGKELSNIVFCKNFDHAKAIIDKTPSIQNVTIVGAGYIGVELVEAFEQQGKNITLIDCEDRILFKYLDQEFSEIAQQQYKNKKIKLALGEKVVKFEGKSGNVSKVITDKNSYDTDLVILCIGFVPNTKVFEGQLDMLPNGAIVVDEYMKTSSKDVFAAGDCCAVYYNPSERNMYIPLATNAIRMGSCVAINLLEDKLKNQGTQGSSAIKIYDELMASTGLTEAEAKKCYDDVKAVTIKENYRPEFMPTFDSVMLKLVYRTSDRRLLGAQLTSKSDYTQTINTLSVCIHNKMTVDEVAFVDQFFQPHFNKPWNIINTAALACK